MGYLDEYETNGNVLDWLTMKNENPLYAEYLQTAF